MSASLRDEAALSEGLFEFGVARLGKHESVGELDNGDPFASRERLGFGRSVRFDFEVDVDVLDVESCEEFLRASAVLAPLGAVDDGG